MTETKRHSMSAGEVRGGGGSQTHRLRDTEQTVRKRKKWRERERETDRQTDRETDRLRDRDGDRETERERENK